MQVLDVNGFPIERIKGRPISYFLRCLLHGRTFRTAKAAANAEFGRIQQERIKRRQVELLTRWLAASEMRQPAGWLVQALAHVTRDTRLHLYDIGGNVSTPERTIGKLASLVTVPPPTHECVFEPTVVANAGHETSIDAWCRTCGATPPGEVITETTARTS